MRHDGVSFARAALSLLSIMLGSGCSSSPPAETRAASDTEAPARWPTYRNETYGFAIDHPPGWQVIEDIEPGRPPQVSFVPGGASPEAPGFHDGPAAPRVSVYPTGLGTEKPFGRARPTEVPFQVPIDTSESVDYLLSDGSPWATFADLAESSLSWADPGFLWAVAAVRGHATECRRKGETVPMPGCDPMMGDEIVRRGEVDDEIRDLEVRILSSFRYLERNPESTPAAGEIEVASPSSGETVASPLWIEGRARGSWFFEGRFQARLIDASGRQLNSVPVRASGEWTTRDWVPFEAEMPFAARGGEGTLVLQKANPSGLAENAAEVRVPVRFRR